MSVSIYWRSVDEGIPFEGGTSTSLKQLQDVFGDEITPQQIPMLRAMAVVSEDSFFAEVAEAVSRTDKGLRFWGVY